MATDVYGNTAPRRTRPPPAPTPGGVPAPQTREEAGRNPRSVQNVNIDPYLERWREISSRIADQLGEGGYNPETATRYFEEAKAPIQGEMHTQANQLSNYLARQGLGSSGINVGGHSGLATNAAALESQAKLKSIDMATEIERRSRLDEFSAEAIKLQPELTKYGIDVSRLIAEMQARLQRDISDRQLAAQEQAGWGNLIGTGVGGALAAGMIFSDERLKKNIKDISSDGDVVFEYTKAAQKKLNLPSGTQIGVLAQDIEDEYPDCVSKDPVTGYKKVNYGRLAIRRTEK